MLTPEDVENKVFKRSMRGYDIEDVEDFLQELGEDFETLYKENIRAEKKISMLTEALKQKQEMQQKPSNTVPITKVIVQKERVQAIDATDAAKKQTETELVKVRKELADTTYYYEQMKRSVEVFRAKVVALLDAQLSIIKDYSEIAIDEETLNRAKALLEAALPEAEKKTNISDKNSTELSQDTREIPAVADKDLKKTPENAASEILE